MSKKHITEHTRESDVPYDADDKDSVREFWDDSVSHRGAVEFRAKRGRPIKPEDEKKEQIALRIDTDVLAWYRDLGTGWQTRMNAVLKAYRDASQ